MLNAMMGASEENNIEKEENKVYSRNVMTDMMSTVSSQVKTNNLEEFKKYIEEENTVISDNANSIEYGYDLDFNLYSSDTENGVVQVNPSQIMNVLGMSTEMSSYSSSSFSSTDVWVQLLDNEEMIKSQYNLLAGKWAENYNEVVLIVDQNGEISDYTLYTLGLLSQDDLKEEYDAMLNGEEFEEKEIQSYTYDELLQLKFKLVLNTDYYQKENGIWIDKSGDEDYMKQVVDNAEEIRVVGIIQVNEESAISSSYGEIGYLVGLQDYIIEKTKEAEIVKEQEENPDINVFTGMEFTDDDETQSEFDMNNLTEEQRAYYASLSSEELAQIMMAYEENINATYESNLENLGVVDIDSPTTINIYPKSFDSKEIISTEIENYNTQMQNEGRDEDVISYDDLVGTLMSSVTTIVDLISSVLIAFVSISLVVSSIMIGIITYISVLERVKEIGILRSIGASKKDISRVFNAETFIVGLIAGVLGIGITLLLNIPINIVIKALSGISNIAQLPWRGGIILVVISMLLTIIAGLIPAKMAAKKDPVEALRTE